MNHATTPAYRPLELKVSVVDKELLLTPIRWYCLFYKQVHVNIEIAHRLRANWVRLGCIYITMIRHHIKVAKSR